MNLKNKQNLQTINDIVSNNTKNIAKNIDLIFSNDYEFNTLMNHVGITAVQLAQYIKLDPQYQSKIDQFIQNNDFNNFHVVSNYEDMLNVLYKNKLRGTYLANEKNEESMEFILNFSINGFSFLGNDNYEAVINNVKALDKMSIANIDSKTSQGFIRDVFAAEGQLEWSVDGSSRLQSAKLLKPLYNSTTLMALTKREFAKSPKFAIEIAQEVETAVDYIVEWSLRPINDNGGSTINLVQQKSLLSICETAIKNHKIPVKSFSNARSFQFACECDHDAFGYKLPSSKKYQDVQAQLDDFKTSLKITKTNKPKI